MRDFGDIGDAYTQGKVCESQYIRRRDLNLGSAWLDESVEFGYPPRTYYGAEPGEAYLANQEYGIPFGGASDAYLASITCFRATVAYRDALYVLCDYLLYYSMLPVDTTEEQFLVNDATLPRYTDGAGVQIAVIGQIVGTVGGTFELKYINQDGAERTTQQFTRTVAASGLALHSTIPFVQLADGDTGVRRVVSFTCLTASQYGTVAILLVKPLASFKTGSTNRTVERVYHSEVGLVMPKILSGAVLNFMSRTSGGGVAPYHLVLSLKFIRR